MIELMSDTNLNILTNQVNTTARIFKREEKRLRVQGPHSTPFFNSSQELGLQLPHVQLARDLGVTHQKL